MINFYLSAILLGLGFASLAIGIFISMRIFNIPDITTDGTFTLGGAITAVLISSSWNSWLILPFVFILGAFAGAITGLIHTLESKCIAFRDSGNDGPLFYQPGHHGKIHHSFGESPYPLFLF